MSQTCTIGQHMPIGDAYDPHFYPKVFNAYDYDVSYEQLLDWLTNWCHQCNPARDPSDFDNIEIIHQGNRFSLPKQPQTTVQPKDDIDKCIGILSSLFSQYLSFSDRIDALRMNDAHDTYNEKPKTALQYIYSGEEKLQQISSVLERILGYKLCINREAGKFIRLHTYHGNLGQYEDIRKYSLVDDHGDGLKGVVGLLLSIFASPKLVYLIDEPEVFLHPPQSRALGRFISQTAKKKNIQFFLSTHDINFVLGLLEGGENVNVIRVTRTFGESDSIASLRMLNAELLKNSWNDPFIRHTRALNGLFYDLVVLCEADGDCLIYSEAAKSIENADRSILYVPTYGKHKFHKYARIFINAGVPVTVIADIDILRADKDKHKHPLRKMLGEKNFATIWEDMVEIKKMVQVKRTKTVEKGNLRDVKKAVTPLERFSPKTDTDRKFLEALKMWLKGNGPVEFEVEAESDDFQKAAWQNVKRKGLDAFNDNEKAKQKVEEIMERLENRIDVKICILKVGELESFCPIDDLHGPSWVIRFMEELQKAQETNKGTSGENLGNSESGTGSKTQTGSATPRGKKEGTSGKNLKNSNSAGVQPEEVLLGWAKLTGFMKEVLSEKNKGKGVQI